VTLHEWIYSIVEEICYDREYVYAVFIRHFGELTNEMYFKGRIAGSGEHMITGLKSGLVADFHWELKQCVNLIRLNTVQIECTIHSTDTGIIESQQTRSFELSTGDEIVVNQHNES
jgi:hypothetical protein